MICHTYMLDCKIGNSNRANFALGQISHGYIANGHTVSQLASVLSYRIIYLSKSDKSRLPDQESMSVGLVGGGPCWGQKQPANE